MALICIRPRQPRVLSPAWPRLGLVAAVYNKSENSCGYGDLIFGYDAAVDFNWLPTADF